MKVKMSVENILSSRGSHYSFFKGRNWNTVNNYYLSIIKYKNIPKWILQTKNNMKNIETIHSINTNNIINEIQSDTMINLIEIENNNLINHQNNQLNYGLTDLNQIHNCLNDDEENRYSEDYYRRTFAIQIGYVGSKYQVIRKINNF